MIYKLYKLRQIRRNDTRKHGGGSNMVLMQNNFVIQYFSFLCWTRNFFLCCAGSHGAGILSGDAVHSCPTSLCSCMAAKCFSKARGMHSIDCLSLLLTHRITLNEKSPPAYTLASQGLNNAYNKGKSWGSCQQFKGILRSFDGRMIAEPEFEINSQLSFC